MKKLIQGISKLSRESIMTKILMVQISNNLWQLETTKGVVLKDDIRVHNPEAAKNYVKSYISSFNSWDYEVRPLQPKIERNKK